MLAAIVVLLAGAVFLSGCTGYPGEDTSQVDITVITTSPTETPAEEPTGVEEWLVWREGSNTLSPLGDYFAYGPNVDGKKFRALKVEVRSDSPVTVLFLNDHEVANFEAKMATNTGEFIPVARYDDVRYQIMEVEADDDLNVVVWNPGTRLAVADVNIWYPNRQVPQSE
jgi:hypothetical protein